MAGKVVIVDDDMFIGDLLRAILESGGHTVTAVSDSAQGLAAVKNAGADLVFLDAMMPDKDGYALARDIRNDPGINQPYLILLTATADRADADRVAEAGIDELMAKPFDAGHLLSKVNRYLSERD